MILSCFTSEWCLFSVTPKQIPVGVLLLAEEANVMVLSQHHTGPDANSLCQSICAELGHWIGIWQATLEAAGRRLPWGDREGTEQGTGFFAPAPAARLCVSTSVDVCTHLREMAKWWERLRVQCRVKKAAAAEWNASTVHCCHILFFGTVKLFRLSRILLTASPTFTAFKQTNGSFPGVMLLVKPLY